MTSSSYQRRGQQAAIQWTCDVCTSPIEDWRGAVWLSWAAHLMEKNWLYETNWDQVLRVVAHTDRQEI